MFRISDKTFNTLSKIQKVLLAIMAIASIIMCILMVFTAGALPDSDTKIPTYSFALTCLAFALAMICGFIYANKDYSKPAHRYYKAMMCFYAFSAFIPIIAVFSVFSFNPVLLISITKFVLLLILGFGKDLGKKNTWIIFYIVLVLELLFSPALDAISAASSTAVPISVGYSIPATLSRLVIVGMFGLCVEAKYRDKDARGTV